MRPGFTPEMRAALRAMKASGRLALVRCVSFHLTKTVARFCTAPRDITLFGGAVFKGMGKFASASEVEEAIEMRATGMRYELSGIPVATEEGISLVEYVQLHTKGGGRVEDYIVLWDASTWSPIGQPRALFRGTLDSPQIKIGGDTFTINIGAEGILGRLNNASNLRLNDETIQYLNPGDRGGEFVSRSQRKPDDFG